MWSRIIFPSKTKAMEREPACYWNPFVSNAAKGSRVHPAEKLVEDTVTGHLTESLRPFFKGRPNLVRWNWLKVVSKRAISAISRRPASSAMATIYNTAPILKWMFLDRGPVLS